MFICVFTLLATGGRWVQSYPAVNDHWTSPLEYIHEPFCEWEPQFQLGATWALDMLVALCFRSIQLRVYGILTKIPIAFIYALYIINSGWAKATFETESISPKASLVCRHWDEIYPNHCRCGANTDSTTNHFSLFVYAIHCIGCPAKFVLINRVGCMSVGKTNDLCGTQRRYITIH